MSKNSKGSYIATGSFAMNNMTQIIKALGDTKYLSAENSNKFPSTQDFSFNTLHLETKLGDSVFRCVLCIVTRGVLVVVKILCVLLMIFR